MKSFVLKKENVLNKVGIFAGSLLVAVVAAYIYSPIVGSNAEDKAESQLTASLNVAGIVGIRANTNELNLTADSGTFVSAPVNVDVTSNSQYGYTLTLEDVDSNTNMVSTEVSDVVSSGFSGSKTSSTMAENNWGYSLDNTDFYAIPVNGSPATLKRTSTVMTTTYETTPVYFGVKVGMHLPATTYADVVRFTAYVNGEDEAPDPSLGGGPTIHDIDTMQEMTPTICSNTTTPLVASTALDTDGSHHGDVTYVPSTTLADTRDGNNYTVRKLADGRCWMTDNLRIVGRDISSDKSNLPSGETWPIVASDLSNFSNDINVDAVYIDSTYGGYYNYFTATAGSGGTNFTAGEAPKDICPKGWRLPTGGSETSADGEFQSLYGTYDTPALLLGVPNFKLAGYVGYYEQYDQGEAGHYWSSSASRSYYFAFSLSVHDYNFGVVNDSRSEGYSVRCIAK